MTDKAIEFLSVEKGNYVIKTLDMQEGISISRTAINPTNPIRTGAGTLITQRLKYSKTDFSLSTSAYHRNLNVYLQSIFDEAADFTMKLYYKDGDELDAGVRGDRAVSVETFQCKIAELERNVDLNGNTYSLDVEILEV
jgi:hypothetical protein